MSRYSSEGPPPDRLITRLLEFAVEVALSGWLIRLGVRYIQDAMPALIVIAVIVGIAVIGWRIWRHKRDTKW